MKRIALLCRGTAQSLDRPSLSLIKTATDLKGKGPIELFLFGPVPEVLPPEVDRIVHFPHEAEAGQWGPDIQGRQLAEAVRRRGADIVLAPANLWGRSVMPVAAALLGAGLTADCTQLWLDGEEQLHQVRPAYGGKLLAEILSSQAAPAMATVRTGACGPDLPLCRSAPVQPIEAEPALSFSGTTYFRMDPLSPETIPRLESSRIVVAGGAGLGSAKNFERIEHLARLLQGTPAASRAAVNAGYAPYSYQVGQSGHSIAPDIYLAIGISGAVQHLSGIQRAKKIIAVNPDDKAPIFDYADYGIIAPWEQFIDTITNHIEEAENYEAGQRTEV